METKLQQEISNILKVFPEYWNEDTLLKNKLIEDIRSYNQKIIEALLSNELVRDTYSLQLQSGLIFKIEDFISMLRFKNYWDNSYTKYTNEIGLTSAGKYLKYNTDVVLDFPHKDSILEGGMTKEETGKEEIYYHNIIAKEEIDTLLSKKTLTGMKKYDENGVQEINHINDNDNLILKGNNLIVLHSLKERYASKVKLIYIDPPYNTGGDSFKYNDRFNRSTWLTFMKNRLEVAQNLLRDDGSIVIQCDNNEQAHLKLLCDDIFGSENFIANISVKMSTLSGVKVSHKDKAILKESEYLLIYSKNKTQLKIKPQYKPTNDISDEFRYYLERNNSNDPKNWTIRSLKEVLQENNLELNFKNDKTLEFINNNNNNIWRRAFIRNKFKSISQENPSEIIRNVDSKGEEHLYYRGRELFFLNQKSQETFTEEHGYKTENAELIGDIWTDINISRLFNEGNISLNNGKKPEFLIARLLDMLSDKNDFILDFFMGSGTTQAVAHKMNRRYIGIEQMDYINTLTIERLKNVIQSDKTGISRAINWQGGGSFVYAELYSLNEEYLQAIQDCSNIDTLGHIIDKMKTSAYLNFKVNLDKVTTQDENFKSLSLAEQKDVLIQVLDMNQLYLNYSEIEDSQYDISDSVKAFNHSFYQKEGNTDE